MKVTLITHTPEPEKIIAASAKLCYSNSDIETLLDNLTEETCKDFLDKLPQAHQSPFEHVTFTFGIEDVSRTFLAQITRHRIASYCLSGDTIIGYDNRTKGMTIRDLYNKKKQYKDMTKIRCIDENNHEIILNSIENVVYSGKQSVYQIKTVDGYIVKATEDHQFYTDTGWKKLKQINIGDKVFTNGIEAYKSKEWLNSKYNIENLSQQEIGDLCDISKHTVRTWVRKFCLQKPLGSWSINKEPPNKNKTKENYLPLQKVSEKMLGNNNSPHWKGKNHPSYKDEITINGGYGRVSRNYKYTNICSICGNHEKTEIHHKDKNPRNDSSDNLIELCVMCHKRKHKGYSVKAVKPSVVESVTYIGLEDTYDIEMSAPHHNFIANGFVVHNCVQSQRYVNLKDTFEYITPPEIQDDEECLKIYNETIAREKWAYNTISNKLKEKYISNGMTENKAEKKAIEDARFVLPNACETKMIVTMNIRSLYNFFTLRCCNNAQWEIRNVANEMLKICKEVSPTLFKKAGASCIRGKCPEGNKNCGKPKGVMTNE